MLSPCAVDLLHDCTHAVLHVAAIRNENEVNEEVSKEHEEDGEERMRAAKVQEELAVNCVCTGGFVVFLLICQPRASGCGLLVI